MSMFDSTLHSRLVVDEVLMIWAALAERPSHKPAIRVIEGTGYASREEVFTGVVRCPKKLESFRE
jgi:hypothetical protein